MFVSFAYFLLVNFFYFMLTLFILCLTVFIFIGIQNVNRISSVVMMNFPYSYFQNIFISGIWFPSNELVFPKYII